MAKTEKTQNISTETITQLQAKDLEKYNKGEQSFLLYNWLKDELILCQYYKVNRLIIEPKALAKIVNSLSSIRQRNMTKCEIKIMDTKTAYIDFVFDLDTLTNAQRYNLNSQYELNLEMKTEPEPDLTYAHMI